MAIDPISAIGSAPIAPAQLTTRSSVPGPALDDSAGPTIPQASDYNAQAALGLAFSSPAVLTSLAPGAAALAALAALPAVGPVEKIAATARTAIYANPYFIDVYR